MNVDYLNFIHSNRVSTETINKKRIIVLVSGNASYITNTYRNQ